MVSTRKTKAQPPEKNNQNGLSPAQDWEFAGWGKAERIEDLGKEPISVQKLYGLHQNKLGQITATAICGNDITSSCLYVSALCALQAGVYAPLALLVVAGVLYLFRKIYAEVGTALPLNGGAYNVLLNTTSKDKASMAACLTLLSYIATAVISAYEAMHYAHNLFHGLPIFYATMILLGIFAFLNYLGISESARVAVGIFIFHLFTLTILTVVSLFVVFMNTETLVLNWHTPPPGSIGHALFFGFAAAMLGISGFESSANYIEEQKEGVFPKTLRNMWIAVAIFNPLLSFLSMGLVPVGEIGSHAEDLLAYMGWISGSQLISSGFGLFFQKWISLNAVLVLSGAVLTSYVGVTGLVRRMSLDRCLPQFLLRRNRFRKTNHWIILLFFILCCSILYITDGNVARLGGVYTLSFLGVMGLFAIGNMLLKIKRDKLPRDERASWPTVTLGLIAVLCGILGNLLLSPEHSKIFLAYLFITLAVVGVMFWRIRILKVILFVSRAIVEKVTEVNNSISDKVIDLVNRISSQTVVFFTRGDNEANLNKAALYVLENEQTKNMKFVLAYEDPKEIPKALSQKLKVIDKLYPQLRIDFIAVQGKFGPELIERLSRRLKVPKNYMFIGCPSDKFPHDIEDLGGVRLII